MVSTNIWSNILTGELVPLARLSKVSGAVNNASLYVFGAPYISGTVYLYE